MLPSVSPTGSYTRAEYDRVRGYIVLIHAEIESYLEDVAIDVAQQSLKKWEAGRRVNRALAALMLHYDILKLPKNSDLTTHFHRAVSEYQKGVRRNNHGIKERNVLEMYSPLGVDHSELAASLLAELDTQGATRGQVAHTSSRKVSTPPDRLLVEAQVNTLLSELTSMDALIQTLVRR